jgi:hypothetical protein
MKTTNLVSVILLAGTCLFLGCGKGSQNQAGPPPMMLNGVAVDMPKLVQAFPTPNPAVQGSLGKLAFGLRYADYSGAVAELGNIASQPDLTDAQRNLVSNVTEQVKLAISKAPPKQ